MFHYWAYGLKLASEISFPELMPISSEDSFELMVSVQDGYSDSNFDSLREKSFVHVEEVSYKLIVPHVAQYEVQGGNSIVIKPFQNASNDAVRLFCLSNAFAAALQQKGQIPLHCAAVRKSEKTILVFGHSGSGKSTTLAGLLEQGFEVISDDVVVPRIHADEVWIDSSYPMIKLWKETIDRFKIWDRVDRKIRPDMEKYGLYFHETFSMEPNIPRQAIFLQKSDECSEVSVSSLTGIELFQRLDSNAYRGENLGHMNLKEEHFKVLSLLAGQVNAFVVSRPAEGDHVQEVVDAVAELLNS